MRIITGMVVLCVLALAVSLFGPASSAVYANGSGAEVRNGFECWITLADGTQAAGVGKCVNNPDGYIQCSCRAQALPDQQLPTEAKHFSGFWCNADGVVTYDSMATLTPSGSVHYKCEVRP